MDTEIGQGSHWVSYRNRNKYFEYFDSFGLMMPCEVSEYLSTSNKIIEYSSDEIQERDSVLCGYLVFVLLVGKTEGKKLIRNNS